MPKVSVILTSYNHEGFLREAIDSVLEQSFEDFELIIWDDASTDGSWSVINGYQDPRIRAFQNETNRRAIHGINRAISEVCSGTYIAIHHSDDAWESQKLEQQVAYLDGHPGVGAVFTNATVVDERGQSLGDEAGVYGSIFNQPNRSRHEWLNHFFYRGNALCHPSVLIRRICYEDCGLYRFGFSQLTDFDMWVRLCLKHEIHVLPDELVRFRIRSHNANVSRGGKDSLVRSQFERLQILNNYRMLTGYEDLVAVFPPAAKFRSAGGFDSLYALAMITLESGSQKYSQLFGLQLLFEALNDAGRADNLRRLYGFDANAFRRLSGEHDVFSFLAAWMSRGRTEAGDPD
jgi:glycosyltransferase involved in cell wall biosynthesis